MNIQKLLVEFNPRWVIIRWRGSFDHSKCSSLDLKFSKFIVYNCFLMFTMLFALRLDETIKISYWLVFSPLFLWKFLMIIGALTGTYIWLTNPSYRLTDSSYVHFKSMLISLSIQLLLLMFELLSCDKVSSWCNHFLDPNLTLLSFRSARIRTTYLGAGVHTAYLYFVAFDCDLLLGHGERSKF